MDFSRGIPIWRANCRHRTPGQPPERTSGVDLARPPAASSWTGFQSGFPEVPGKELDLVGPQIYRPTVRLVYIVNSESA